MDWRGFELHPEVPVGGLAVEQAFPPDRIEPMRRYLAEFAGRFGVDEMGAPPRISNTRAALAAVEWARDQGALEPMWHALMDAHWREGRDIEDDDVLRSVAERAGLDPEGAVAASRDPVYLDRVGTIRREAHEAGVAGIPAFLFGDERVVGCQPYEQLAAAAERAGAQRR